jgi:chromosomal replication initiation ATPase DnaA
MREGETMNEPDPILIGLRGYKSREIIRPILVRHNMTWQQAIAKCRHKEYLLVREDIYGALRMAGLSLPQIGRVVGGRDHTTVFHSLKKWEQRQKASVNSDVQRPARGPEEKLIELFAG